MNTGFYHRETLILVLGGASVVHGLSVVSADNALKMVKWSMAAPQNEWVKRRWAELIEEYGGCCEDCQKTYDLEFAHTKPTGLRGKGRGKSRRLYDILRNRDCYRLLCFDCHDILDGMHRHRQQDYIKRGGRHGKR